MATPQQLKSQYEQLKQLQAAGQQLPPDHLKWIQQYEAQYLKQAPQAATQPQHHRQSSVGSGASLQATSQPQQQLKDQYEQLKKAQLAGQPLQPAHLDWIRRYEAQYLRPGQQQQQQQAQQQQAQQPGHATLNVGQAQLTPLSQQQAQQQQHFQQLRMQQQSTPNFQAPSILPTTGTNPKIPNVGGNLMGSQTQMPTPQQQQPLQQQQQQQQPLQQPQQQQQMMSSGLPPSPSQAQQIMGESPQSQFFRPEPKASVSFENLASQAGAQDERINNIINKVQQISKQNQIDSDSVNISTNPATRNGLLERDLKVLHDSIISMSKICIDRLNNIEANLSKIKNEVETADGFLTVIKDSAGVAQMAAFSKSVPKGTFTRPADPFPILSGKPQVKFPGMGGRINIQVLDTVGLQIREDANFDKQLIVPYNIYSGERPKPWGKRSDFFQVRGQNERSSMSELYA